MHSSLLRAITSGVWMMERNAAEAYFPMVERILRGDAAPDANAVFEHFTPFYTHVGAGDSPVHFFAKQGDNHRANEEAAQIESMQMAGSNGSSKVVAVIPIVGPIIKYSEPCGQYGTETMAEWIRSAAANPQVEAIVLQVDGPGGQGNAVQNISRVIKEADAQKPVLVNVSGMAASASYWIAANGREVYASDATDMIGSIGTYLSLMDWKKFYEAQGLDIKEFYATKSTKKNALFKNVFNGVDENGDVLIKEFVDPFNESFIAAVAENRPNAKEAVFTGELFFADVAKKMGLIDGIKSLDQTIIRASQLARKQTKSNGTKATADQPAINSINDMKVNLKSGWNDLLSFFKTEVPEGAESVEHEITPEALEEMNARLAETSDLESQLATATSDHDATTASLATATARIAELEAIVARKPAVGTTVAVQEADDKGHAQTEEKAKPSYVTAAEEHLNRGKKK